MNVGFTGTQKGMTSAQEDVVYGLLEDLFTPEGSFHHGDCVGADAEAHSLAYLMGWRVMVHPPTDPDKRAYTDGAAIVLPERPYLERNRAIVNSTEMLIATPGQHGEVLRSGTWATIRYARKVGRKIHVVFPDGDVTTFTSRGLSE